MLNSMFRKRMIIAICAMALLVMGYSALQRQSTSLEITGSTIAMKGRQNFVITEDGRLWVWGISSGWAHLSGDLGARIQTPINILENVVTVSSSDRSPRQLEDGRPRRAMAITEDGGLWNLAFEEQRNDDGSIQWDPAPERIKGDVISVSIGRSFVMVLKNDGSLWTWGRNEAGQLGDARVGVDWQEWDNSSPDFVKIMDGVVAISAGHHHAMAIREDGSLWTWGANNSGQLGNGTVTSSWNVSNYTPTRIMDDVVYISAGDSSSAAIKTDGSLWIWGQNSIGRPRYSTEMINRHYPERILDDVALVSCRALIKTDGSMWAWGRTSLGSISAMFDKTSEVYEPIQIMEDVIYVQTCYDIIALRDDGSLWHVEWHPHSPNNYVLIKEGVRLPNR